MILSGEGQRPRIFIGEGDRHYGVPLRVDSASGVG